MRGFNDETSGRLYGCGGSTRDLCRVLANNN